MAANENTSIVLIGIGGYGSLYVDEWLDALRHEGVVLQAVVDPFPERCKRLSELSGLGIPLHASLEDFHADNSADLAVISSPIQFHESQVIQALDYGSHVLCEKPAAASPGAIERMIRKRDAVGKKVGIGFQWSFSQAVLDCKKDILAGRFGKPVCLKSRVLWPRDWSYYARGWAGKKKDAEGRLVLDSVAANATAHYIHNGLYLLGSTLESSAVPLHMDAEVYRANEIENYDTAALRFHMDQNVPFLFLASHAIQKHELLDPEFEYTFELGALRYTSADSHIRAVFKDGSVKDYGDPFANHVRKLYTMLEIVRNGGNPPCGLEAAMAHARCIAAIEREIPVVPEFPQDLVVRDVENRETWVEGLAEVMNHCYDKEMLPSETGVSWAFVRHADI